MLIETFWIVIFLYWLRGFDMIDAIGWYLIMVVPPWYREA